VKLHVDVNAYGSDGATPLVYADAKDLEFLLEHGADPNRGRLGGMPPLEMACAELDVAKVRELLNHGADPKWRDVNGETLLIVVANEAHASFANNHKSVPPSEISRRASEIAQILVERGADPAEKNSLGPNGSISIH
jgi:ankyrin repeat protein